MRALVILPNWLGDAIMCTPAIESLVRCYEDIELVFVGSFVSVEALRHHPRCTASYIDDTKKGGNRFRNTYRFAKKLGSFDIAVNFRNQLFSSLLLFFVDAKRKIMRSLWHSKALGIEGARVREGTHLVIKYNALIESLCAKTLPPRRLRLYVPPHRYERPTLGINAGATYGMAKRWYPERFAAVAEHFCDDFDIVIFGGENEAATAKEIEEALSCKRVVNLAGKTSIKELSAYIGGLSLFITNDSGPMHIAAAYGVATVAIFGPTKHNETSQWMNDKGVIVRKEIACAPCMKRTCPLGHHECMRSISAEEVIKETEKLI